MPDIRIIIGSEDKEDNVLSRALREKQEEDRMFHNLFLQKLSELISKTSTATASGGGV